MITTRALGLAAIAGCAPLLAANAQWKNRYPLVGGMSHYVYLEGYELPLLTNGPMDAAPSPDGKRLAFSSRGWI